MRVVFMGSPEFAVPTLAKLLSGKHEIAGVVTVPDRRAGRGQKLTPSRVKQFADLRGLPVFQPDDLADTDFLHQMRSLRPDVMVVVAFRLLPEALFTIPPLGTINLHASLLPAYRGPAPIQWALINGEKRTGVTTFLIDIGVDTGGLLAQRGVAVPSGETAGELAERLSVLGAQLVVESLTGLRDHTLTPQPQTVDGGRRAPKIRRHHCGIDWTCPAWNVHNLVRGLSPEPGAFSRLQGHELKVLRSKVVNRKSADAVPGTVRNADKRNGFIVQCGRGQIRLEEVMRAGKRRMSGVEFLAGAKLQPGDQFNGSAQVPEDARRP